MKSLLTYILEAANQLEDKKLKELLKPYNEGKFEDFNGKNVDLINYLEKNYKQNKIEKLGDLDAGDAFVKCAKENEFGGIYSITFGFVEDDGSYNLINYHMKTNTVKIDAWNSKRVVIDKYDECYYLDAMNLEGVLNTFTKNEKD